MLKGYLIEKYNGMGNAYTCARLLEEAAAAGISLDMVGVHDTVSDGSSLINGGKVLEDRDFVINRYKWGHIKDEINSLASRGYNPIDGFKPYIDKYLQLKTIDSGHFLKPKYLLGTVAAGYDLPASLLGTPFIAKGLASSMGREIRLIDSVEAYASLAKEFPEEKEFLFEELIPTSLGRDLRVFCLRGEAVACMVRESRGDFRANVALGATVRSHPVTAELQAIASDIYRLTRLDVVGIDLLFGKDCLYFCEINVMPGLEGIEQASGINIARRTMEMIREDFK